MRHLQSLADRFRAARAGRQSGGMFGRFTERAKRVVFLAQEQARIHGHDHVDTEHILLGIVEEGRGVAAKTLESLGITLESIREHVEEAIEQGKQAPSEPIPYTPQAKKVLELALREAQHLRHNYIGTEHILLGLIREGAGVAGRTLARLGADDIRVRDRVLGLLSGQSW
jgi:ATP-dependent Clp protease ATP-binding subunit ClpC